VACRKVGKTKGAALHVGFGSCSGKAPSVIKLFLKRRRDSDLTKGI
jgi:hypothetical protein